MADSTVQDTLVLQVEQALDQIRPYLKTDGGDVRVLGITDENVAQLELLGACGTCPMSTMTFKGGIEQAIMRAVPQIKGVEAVNLTPLDAPAVF